MKPYILQSFTVFVHVLGCNIVQSYGQSRISSEVEQERYVVADEPWTIATELRMPQNAHRKAKYGIRNHKWKLYNNGSNKTMISHPSLSDMQNLHFNKCAKYRKNSKFHFLRCKYTHKQALIDKINFSKITPVFHQRKLLSALTKPSKSVTVKGTDTVNTTQSARHKTNTKEQDEEYERFLSIIKQKLSRDPQRAMFSLLFLLMIMMVTIKLCGMKPMKHISERPRDFQDDVHYLGIYDILKLKQPYLPKKLLQWNRKLRRKLRKKKSILKVKDKDLGDPISDNTDEERLIYARVYDF